MSTISEKAHNNFFNMLFFVQTLIFMKLGCLKIIEIIDRVSNKLSFNPLTDQSTDRCCRCTVLQSLKINKTSKQFIFVNFVNLRNVKGGFA